jgi:hypothetical protein
MRLASAGPAKEASPAFWASVTLAGSTETLRLDQSSTFTGTVSGFGRESHAQHEIAFDTQTPLGYLPNSNQTAGTLTFADGTRSANIALLDNHLKSSFAVVNDNSGGTMVVTEASQASNQSLPTKPHEADRHCGSVTANQKFNADCGPTGVVGCL